MSIYRFRVLHEDDSKDPVFRDVEIDENASFEDFHKAIVAGYALAKDQLASFYLCDKNWVKTQEISLENMNEDEDGPTKLMKDVKISEVLSEENVKLIYVYDFFLCITFFIDVLKIIEPEDGVVYPLCVRSVGFLSEANDEFIDPEIMDEFSDNDEFDEFDEFNDLSEDIF